MFRDGKYIFKKFYDEREWRYVPKLTQNKLIEISRLSKKDYMNSIFRAQANSRISGHIKLSFEPDDIKCLSVNKYLLF